MMSVPGEIIEACNVLGLLSAVVLLVVFSSLQEEETSEPDTFFLSELRLLRLHLAQSIRHAAVSGSDAPVDLSIVIPAFNERARIVNTLLATIRWCRSHAPSYEIIVADDGSSDETMQICRIFQEYHGNFTVLANPHHGKGAAVRAGMLQARGKYVLFMDADGATPLKEIEKLRAKLAEGAALAIGSRKVRSAGETAVARRLHRKVIGKMFAAIVRLFGVSGIGDTQCGFKMFRGDVVRGIFCRQRLNGFAFDVEVLLLARKLSLQIAEVPIDWSSKEGSKVNLVLDTLRMLADVLKVKMMHRTTYSIQPPPTTRSPS